MKMVTTMGAQGDCLFRRISQLPPGAKERRDPTGSIIVAHSETGHHHSIDDVRGLRVFDAPSDRLISYLVLEGVEYADVVHHRSFDTHGTIRLIATPGQPTVFEVRRQREYAGEAQASRPVWD